MASQCFKEVVFIKIMMERSDALCVGNVRKELAFGSDALVRMTSEWLKGLSTCRKRILRRMAYRRCRSVCTTYVFACCYEWPVEVNVVSMNAEHVMQVMLEDGLD
mmetsp:Transcript_13668/g.17902  ORF Transcript_13668/g.17902 Transcript_13668/m.17902 type:complete len:105 (-) Transcript_13668:186-500(-)